MVVYGERRWLRSRPQLTHSSDLWPRGACPRTSVPLTGAPASCFLSTGRTSSTPATSPIGFAARSKSGRRKADQRPEAVDADGPVDAQSAPTGPWKTEDGFPRAPTAVIGSEERSRKNVRQPQGGQMSVSQGGQISLTNAAGTTGHDSNDRCLYPPRWPLADLAPIHAAGHRHEDAAPPTQNRTTCSTAPAHHPSALGGYTSARVGSIENHPITPASVLW